jgi:hypothetical protein
MIFTQIWDDLHRFLQNIRFFNALLALNLYKPPPCIALPQPSVAIQHSRLIHQRCQSAVVIPLTLEASAISASLTSWFRTVFAYSAFTSKYTTTSSSTSKL